MNVQANECGRMGIVSLLPDLRHAKRKGEMKSDRRNRSITLKSLGNERAQAVRTAVQREREDPFHREVL